MWVPPKPPVWAPQILDRDQFGSHTKPQCRTHRAPSLSPTDTQLGVHQSLTLSPLSVGIHTTPSSGPKSSRPTKTPIWAHKGPFWTPQRTQFGTPRPPVQTPLKPRIPDPFTPRFDPQTDPFWDPPKPLLQDPLKPPVPAHCGPHTDPISDPNSDPLWDPRRCRPGPRVAPRSPGSDPTGPNPGPPNHPPPVTVSPRILGLHRPGHDVLIGREGDSLGAGPQPPVLGPRGPRVGLHGLTGAWRGRAGPQPPRSGAGPRAERPPPHFRTTTGTPTSESSVSEKKNKNHEDSAGTRGANGTLYLVLF